MLLRHWTDGKIRRHVLTCIVALAYLMLLEIRLQRAGLMITARQAIKEMQKRHSCLCWADGRSKPKRMLEELTPLQYATVQHTPPWKRRYRKQIAGITVRKHPPP